MLLKPKSLVTLLVCLNILNASGSLPLVFAQTPNVGVNALVESSIPGAPSMNPLNSCATTSRDVSLSAAGPAANREYFYELSADNFNTNASILDDSGWIASISFRFPSGNSNLNALTSGTTYFYRAKARNPAAPALESGYSNIVSAVQQASCGGNGGGGDTPAPTTFTCSDSDGGQQSNQAGSITIGASTGTSNAYSDACVSGGAGLVEYYCASPTSSSPSYTTVSCPYGCSNNACLSAPANTNSSSGNGNQNTSQPIIATTFLTSPAPWTNTRSIDLITSATGADTMCFSGDLSSGVSPWCVPYGNVTPITLTPGEGEKNLSVQFKNESGFMSAPLTVSLTLDTLPPAPPQFTVVPQTEERLVTLNLTNAFDASWIYISGDIQNTGETFEWINITSGYELVLVGGSGPKTVTVQTKDAAGNVSESVSLTVLYLPPDQNTNQNPNTNQVVVPVPNDSHNVNGSGLPSQNANTSNPITNSNVIVNPNQNARPLNSNQSQLPASTNSNGTPVIYAPESSITDTDQDGLTDSDETNIYHTDPNLKDSDQDGLTDGQEINIYHTDARDPDTDTDYLNDGDEVNRHHTDPLASDTDGDRYGDGVEIMVGTDPLDPNSHPQDPLQPLSDTQANIIGGTPCTADSDQDGLADCLERRLGTDAGKRDTDGDGFSDGEEVLEYATNPLDPSDNPNSRMRLKISNWKNQDIMTGSDWLIKGICEYPGQVRVFLQDKDQQEIDLGETTCLEEKKFLVLASENVSDGYYDLFTRRYDPDRHQLEESRKINIVVDKSKAVNPPRPEALDHVSLKEFAAPYLEASIIIQNNRPTVFGKTNYGSTVHATFESVITSSSVIADSAAGDFSISAANPLEIGGHHVTLYAVTPEGARSSTVTIPFMITDPLHASAGAWVFPWWLLILLLIISCGLTWWYYKRSKEEQEKKAEQKA